MPKKLIEIASEIVQTQATLTPMSATELTNSLKQVFKTLQEMQKSEETGTTYAVSFEPEPGQEAAPALTPEKSIQNDKVICLECGAEMKQLTAKHLSAHGISPKEYKKKYGFTQRTSLAAKALTKARSKAAKKRGLPEKLRQFIEARRQSKGEGGKAVEKPKRAVRRKKTEA
jgi:predicted transcriptional regulator